MRDILGESLKWVKRSKKRKQHISTALLVLSALVVLDVFWILRQPALTQAGDATCGIVEHTHDENCHETKFICTLSEEAHVHQDGCWETVETENGQE